jgi:hypothetical protein
MKKLVLLVLAAIIVLIVVAFLFSYTLTPN